MSIETHQAPPDPTVTRPSGAGTVGSCLLNISDRWAPDFMKWDTSRNIEGEDMCLFGTPLNQDGFWKHFSKELLAFIVGDGEHTPLWHKTEPKSSVYSRCVKTAWRMVALIGSWLQEFQTHRSDLYDMSPHATTFGHLKGVHLPLSIIPLRVLDRKSVV